MTSCSLGLVKTGAEIGFAAYGAYKSTQVEETVLRLTCPDWVEKFKLTDEEKAATPVEVKRMMVKHNDKVDCFCHEINCPEVE